jgi:beta-glucanase (GH16 family)
MSAAVNVTSLTTSFNTYGVVWNETALAFYINDVTRPYFTLVPTPPNNLTWGYSPYIPFTPMYLILNSAVIKNGKTSCL